MTAATFDKVGEAHPGAVLLPVARDRAEQQIGHGRRGWEGTTEPLRAGNETAGANDSIGVSDVGLQAGDECDRRAEFDRAEFRADEGNRPTPSTRTA